MEQINMEQINNNLPDQLDENLPTDKDSKNNKMNSFLLMKVRENFGIFGSISLLFGIAFTFFFYRAKIGLNALLFSLVMIILLHVIMKKLSIPMKKATFTYYLGIVLLGVSTMLTSSWILQFINIIGILILLDLSLLHQVYEDSKWDFAAHIGRMFYLVLSCIAVLGMPFKDCYQFLKNTKLFKNEKVRNIATGVIIAIPLLWVIIGLLSSADLIFGKMTNGIYNFIFSSNLFYVVTMTFFGFLACYCIICAAVAKAGMEEKSGAKKANASIAATIISLLCIVYVMFCSLQVIYLFANGLFVLPVEFTFAEYARRGFFELLTVTVINILLMIICTSLFEESKIIRFFLVVMTACTYIMIGSAVYRMLLYIGAYNLTFLRLFVLLFLLIDSLVLGGVIVFVYHKKFPLFGYCVAVITSCYLLFSFAKPDYFIASYHIHEKKEFDVMDIVYLTKTLSFDAAPIMVPFLEEEYDKIKINTKSNQNDYDPYIDNYGEENSVKDYYKEIIHQENERGFRDFNFSYYFALRSIEKIEKIEIEK